MLNKAPRGLAMLLLPLVAYGRIGILSSSEEMLAASDTVLRGEVISVPSSRATDTATIRIIKLIKGNVPTATINIRYPNADFQGFTKNEYVLLFLKKQHGDIFTLTDLDNSKFLAPKRPPTSINNSAPRSALIQEYEEMADDENPLISAGGLKGLIELSGPTSKGLLKKFLYDNRALVRAQAISGLVQLDDADAARMMLSELLSSSINSPSISGTQQLMRSEFINTLKYIGRKKSIQHSSILIRLVDHKDRFIRNAAIRTLRQIKDPKTTSTFIQLLDDTDVAIQYIATISLCEMHSTNCPSGVLFKQNPQEHILKWKSWWEKNKKKM